MAKRGLYENIHRKRKRIAQGSGEKMRSPGDKGAPSAKDFAAKAKPYKKKKKKKTGMLESIRKKKQQKE